MAGDPVGADLEPHAAPAPRDRAGRRQVLFACTWNATRSPMAAALVESIAGDQVQSFSAGVHRGRPVDPMAVQAMAEIGLDISRHRPHCFTDIEAEGGDLGGFDVIVALSSVALKAAEAVARHAPVQVEHWAVEDPTQEDGAEDLRLEAYRRVRDQLAEQVRLRFAGAAA